MRQVDGMYIVDFEATELFDRERDLRDAVTMYRVPSESQRSSRGLLLAYVEEEEDDVLQGKVVQSRNFEHYATAEAETDRLLETIHQ